MKRLLGIAGLVVALAVGSTPVWAVTDTADVAVTANVATRADLALVKDANSVVRFAASQLQFDRYDDQDGNVPSPNANFMYAPYRSETGKNWHVASIIANGTQTTLEAAVTGNLPGNIPLSSRLSLFTGGWFATGASSPLPGTTSADWESADAYTEQVSVPFNGTVPFNYRLDVTGIPAGTYSGQITYTLTSL